MRTGSTSLTALRNALDGAASEGADTRLLGLKVLNFPRHPRWRPSAGGDDCRGLRHDLEQSHLSGFDQWRAEERAGLVDPARRARAPVPDQQADRPGRNRRRRAGTAVHQRHGVQRARAARLGGADGPACRQSWSVFNPEGRLIDTTISDELHGLGAEVVRAAVQFQREGTCDYAEHRQFAAQFRRAGLSGCSVSTWESGTGSYDCGRAARSARAASVVANSMAAVPTVSGRLFGRTSPTSTTTPAAAAYLQLLVTGAEVRALAAALRGVLAVIRRPRRRCERRGFRLLDNSKRPRPPGARTLVVAGYCVSRTTVAASAHGVAVRLGSRHCTRAEMQDDCSTIGGWAATCPAQRRTHSGAQQCR